MRNNNQYYFLVLGLVFFLTPFQSLLAQLNLDEVGLSSAEEELLFADIPSVFSASKYEQKVTEAPARISIVTGDEIQRYGHRTLLDIFNSLPGFQTTYDRNFGYIGTRGFGVPGDYNTRILFLIDGHRVNENLYDGVTPDKGFLVDIDLINRVEVVKGPASSLYGGSAFLAVINIITKTGRDIEGTELSLATGSEQSHQARLSYGERLDNGIELLVSATLGDRKGHERLYYAEFDDPSTNNGFAENVDDGNNRNLLLNLSYGDFTVSALYQKHEKGIPTASYETIFNDPGNRTFETQAYLDFKYQHLLDNGAEVTARFFYDSTHVIGDYIYDYADPGDPLDRVVFVDEAYGDWWGTELLLTREWFDNHRITLGTEYRNNLREDQDEFDTIDVYLSSRESSSVAALFVQDEFRFSEQLIFNLGIRHDDYSTVGGTTNPRAAVIWSPLQQTTLKFLYGTAFRAPNPYELYYHDGDLTQKVSQGLEPETIETYELILEQQLNSNLRLVASVFQNNLEDLITLITDPSDSLLVYVNLDQATAKGAELELQGHFESGWSGAASYSYQNVEDGAAIRVINSVRNMAKINLIAPLAGDDFSAGLELQYESGRKTLGGNETDARVITNLTLFSRNWVDNMKVSASLYNLADETYTVPGFEEHEQNQIEQDGRSFRLKLDYKF